MSVPTVTTTISYRGAGLQAPVFVAGSFTDPSWRPLEMRKGQDVDGEANFSATVQVMANTVYQYKFKIGRGEGERWVLDENCPTGMDEAGNRNNVLKVLSPLETARQLQPLVQADSADKLGHHGPCMPTLAEDLEVQVDEMQLAASNVIAVETANRYADDECNPSRGKSSTPLLEDLEGDEVYNIDEILQTPLFAHESFGGYTFVDDGADHDDAPTKRHRPKAGQGYALGSFEMDDPSIDTFASEKPSLTDSLSKMHIGWGDVVLGAEDFVYPSYEVSRRASLDSADDGTVSSGSLSPTSTRRRDSRLSHSSFGRTRSAVSLGSIAEEDQLGPRQLPSGHVSHPPIIAIPQPPSKVLEQGFRTDRKLTSQQERGVRRD
ncbi:hypothetical protein S7711_00324 [Stachybotrys chartarum IBT 7711]|uniref:AMP-activated protein kinase glycogen-binding domain-containing protein n=1 Tax=Stachybotrys chartarum (strain CBS 109288 / IBT 7711) TaxID=1280523 RepID=A0A084B9D5_STACB|nr:hypothetical protein S7711_00324 [Stachybotrys chartarum IBT 7711]KFA55487.1 hypothetical protein S40293_02059 [Stachybotrys chartarum IBT 40293]